MRNTPTSLGRRLSASRALLPAESVWAPVPEEGLCPRPGAQRLAAQAGPFPTVATRAQPRAHSSRTGWLVWPLAAQPGSCHGTWGPARHNPLAAVQACPAQLATRGAAQPSQGGLPACASVGDGKLRRAGGGALLGFLQHPRSWPPAGAKRTVCTKLQVPCQRAGSVTVVSSVIIPIILRNPG